MSGEQKYDVPSMQRAYFQSSPRGPIRQLGLPPQVWPCMLSLSLLSSLAWYAPSSEQAYQSMCVDKLLRIPLWLETSVEGESFEDELFMSMTFYEFTLLKYEGAILFLREACGSSTVRSISSGIM